MTVYGVHGWYEQDKGKGSVGSLAPAFEESGLNYRLIGHEWPRLPVRALLKQRKRTREVAAKLASQLKDHDSVIGFSNGNPVIRHAIEQSGVLIRTWVAIAPALPRSVEIPLNVQRVIVLHSDGDWAVSAGRGWAWINPAHWVLGHDWGDMGRVGYTGSDNRVDNWPSRRGVSHGGWFDDEPLEYWGPRIAEAVTPNARN